MNNDFEKSIRNRNYIIFGLIILVIIGFSSNFISMDEPEKQSSRLLKTQYFMQNPDGKIIDTWNEWHPVESVTIYIDNKAGLSENRITLVENTIMSTETIEIDSKTFWKGMKGLADYARNEIGMPSANWMLVDDVNANVIFLLDDAKDPDSLSGMTTVRFGESVNIPSYATITVFDVNNLSDKELETILRHEVGHAAGLSHSNDPNDLMYPVVSDANPYYSQCDADALISLYNTNVIKEFICKS